MNKKANIILTISIDIILTSILLFVLYKRGSLAALSLSLTYLIGGYFITRIDKMIKNRKEYIFDWKSNSDFIFSLVGLLISIIIFISIIIG